MQPRDWKVKPQQMNKIWYKKTNILTNILTNFDYKKDAKTQFAIKSLTIYFFVFFLYKKSLLSNKKIRIVKFPKVNKTIIKWSLNAD